MQRSPQPIFAMNRDRQAAVSQTLTQTNRCRCRRNSANYGAMMKGQTLQMNQGQGTRREVDDAVAADVAAVESQTIVGPRGVRGNAPEKTSLRARQSKPVMSSTMSRCSTMTSKIR